MKTLHKRLVTTAVIASMLAIPLSVSFTGDAEARDRGYRGGYYHGHRGGGGNTGAYIGLGLGAFALGTALALSATQPSYAAPPAYYAPPPPAYYQAPTYYEAPPPVYYSAPVYDPYRNTYVYNPQYDRNSP